MNDSNPPSTTSTTSTSAFPKKDSTKPRKRSWLRTIASVLTLSLTFVILGALGGLIWLVGSENGLRFALLKLPEIAHVYIQANDLKGTIWKGFSAKNIAVHTPQADYTLSEWDWDWQAIELLQNQHLKINYLKLGDLHIHDKSAPETTQKSPPKLPEHLTLPIQITADELSIGKITQGEKRVEWLRGAKLSYYYHDENHQVKIHSVQTEWSQSHGDVRLAANAPFVLQGELHSTGELDGIPIQNESRVSGKLSQLIFKTNLSGLGIALNADTEIQPFAPTIGDKIGHIRLDGKGINPKAFMNHLPKANLTFNANVLPNLNSPEISLSGQVNVHNQTPLSADQNGIPVRQLDSEFLINQSGAIELKSLNAQLMKQGKIALSGGIYALKQTLNLHADLTNVVVNDVITPAQPIDGILNGRISATGTFTQPQFHLKVNTGRADVSGLVKLLTNQEKKQTTVAIENGKIQSPRGGQIALSGQLELFENKKLSAQIASEDANLSEFYPKLPVGKINGNINLTGELAKTAFQAEMKFRPSQLLGAVLSGEGVVHYENQYLSQADVALVLGDNVLKTKGSFGKKGATLNVDLNAPNMQQFGFGIRGNAQVQGKVTSLEDGWTQVEAQLSGMARNVHMPNAVDIQTLDFKVQGSPDVHRPLDISVQGKQIRAGETVIDAVDANLKGSLRQHRLSGSGQLKIDQHPLKINLDANGGLNEQNQWLGTVSTLNLTGALNLVLQNTLRLEAGAQRVNLSSARWQALGGHLNLEQFSWDKQQGLTTKGRAENLHFSELHRFYTPPIEHNLVLSGDWDLSYSQSPRGYLNVRQQSGDVILPTARKQALNLSDLVIKTQFNQQGILSQFNGSTRYGQAQGQLDILQAFGGAPLAQAPIRGKIQILANELKTLRNILPVGQTIQGTLRANMDISGQLNQPKMYGTIDGENLAYRHRDVGVVLSHGTLKSHFQDQTWVVDALTFRRNSGTVTLKGTASYGTEEPDVRADIVFDRYQILDQPNRRLTVSGSGKLIYIPSKGIDLTGQLKTDEGKFGFQESSAPTLGDDVVILGETKTASSAGVPFKLDLGFDLNNQFAFSGDGLNVLLGGKLNLSTRPNSTMQAVGSVNIVRGQYKAYGQDLTVKKGIISFVGPLDNPNLNIRAERRNSPVGAGVEVLGNLNVPRISLVANEPMSEKDKLSWLVLNRASSGSSGDNAALSAAAGAFLAGKLNDKMGLVDDFGLTSQQTRNAQTGEMNPAQQVLTFGKQLTQDLYLGYEAGLENASQSVKLVYQLGRSFQAILRAGTESSGAELKYVKRFDGFSDKRKAQFKQLELESEQAEKANQPAKTEKMEKTEVMSASSP